MLKKSALIFAVLLLGTIALLQGRASIQAADLFQSPLATPRAAALDEVTLESLLERIEALETRVAELEEAQVDDAQAYRIYVANYLMDDAGLHDLDVRLNEEGLIMPYDRGQLLRIVRLIAVVDWPESLAEDAEALGLLLEDLAAALGDDDLETAAPLATEVHDLQHDLSHDVGRWLAQTLNAGEDEHDSHGHSHSHDDHDDDAHDHDDHDHDDHDHDDHDDHDHDDHDHEDDSED
jgi:hypothetical protein